MKTKIFAALLAACMILSMASIAMAATTVTTAAQLNDALQAGGDIVLGANIDATGFTCGHTTGSGRHHAAFCVPTGVSATLDLNGYTIKAVQSSNVGSNTALIMLIHGSELTIKDSKGTGKISYEYTGPSDSYSYTHDTIANNQSTLTIYGGTFENLTNVTQQISYVIDTLTNGGIGDATTTIHGGTFSSPNYQAIRAFCNSTTKTCKVVINDATVTGRVILHDSNEYANLGVLQINGGTFNASTSHNATVAETGKNDVSGLSIEITDGVFNAPITAATQTGFISGGSFAEDPDDSYIVPGEDAVKIGDRWYLGDSLVKVSFDGNGGTGTMAAIEQQPVGDYTLPANGFTAPAGKQFKGWKVNGTEYAAGDVIELDADTIIIAVWEAIPATATPTPAPAAPAAPAPKTGDNTNIALWMSLVLISGVALLGLRKKASK